MTIQVDKAGSTNGFNGISWRSAARSAWRAVEPVVRNSAAIVIFLLIWEMAPRLDLINRTFLPPFLEVIVKGAEYAWAGELLPQILVSVGRAAGGFALGVATAIPLGLLLGWYRPLESYLNPLLQLLRQTNPVSLFPAFILFFGIGYLTNVVIIYWVVVWPLLLATVNGVRQADPALIKYARSVGLPDRQIFLKVVLPSAVPSIITGARLAATYSFLMLVVSEMVGATSGLGYLIVNAQYLLSIHLLYVGVIVLALLGIASNWGLVALERRLTAWKQDIRS
ncbi:ABC transporter permease [Mesorhizobium sp.]|uniref:ABC transporter permease n=1 Tax=Mesorhizobium sp. TaxID=1871066 RepID=UPI000FE69491|nr:ABC transporter permease [Mesorhizobium sp.]RWI16791.1 MAG: ABC transporter permease [Mesorhizobium sp.]RWN08718.1 MAG: ABC transporter permease [Mesorhizobium sp.]RWN16144.1 MAG: ABC transporter permease [Mesorhizobium sp.]TIQ97554.1 MAG: ABC transporter permease [Mesorhizobium sp.]